MPASNYAGNVRFYVENRLGITGRKALKAAALRHFSLANRSIHCWKK
jgi:hypothetical protein